MSKDKMLEMARMMYPILNSKIILRNLLGLFSTDKEIDEMMSFIRMHENLTKYDINTEAYRITMSKYGIEIPSYEECQKIRKGIEHEE